MRLPELSHANSTKTKISWLAVESRPSCPVPHSTYGKVLTVTPPGRARRLSARASDPGPGWRCSGMVVGRKQNHPPPSRSDSERAVVLFSFVFYLLRRPRSPTCGCGAWENILGCGDDQRLQPMRALSDAVKTFGHKIPHKLRLNLAVAGCLKHPGAPPVETRGKRLQQELEHLSHHLTVHVRAGSASNGQKCCVLPHRSQGRFIIQ